ncbi:MULTISPECIES: hypothetical protein [unclassified Nitrospirillum]|uniref:Uncharacterized protein n=2 Tax=Nitrospirillum amazonense TaxID=28077 RepID=A0A560H877_9PROT|nr:hypothetical protein [Nitrospirillum sp. BR 11828]MDZ5648903.1 hypothetical protein [Nitrospirillum sp. BR 11828]MEE3622928.1 hypothetical protein [Nitrospirillum sp. BR 11752]TWB42542.1 hypothetical protein FBZ90_106139 [Nitrospirillum amazonense]
MEKDERRLGDRILSALELALEHGNLTVAEPLAQALELCMTAFGGPDAVDHRGVPTRLLQALDRLDSLRRAEKAA